MIIQGINVGRIMIFLLNGAAMSLEYNWSKDYNQKEMKRMQNQAIEELKRIEFSTLTEEEKTFLGFIKHGEDYLIPLWLLRALPNGMVVKSILNEYLIIGVDRLDTDVRGGCIAYSIVR